MRISIANMVKKHNWLYGGLSVFLLILVWQVAGFNVNNRTLLPYPIDVVNAMSTILTTTSTYQILLYSFFRLTTAIIIAGLLGISFGLVAGFSRTVSSFFQPLVTSLRTVPVASIIVVVLILFGSSKAIYIITFVMLFPILFEATKQGVLNIDQSLIEALSLEQKRTAFTLVNMFFPLSIPYIKTGILQSIGLGFKVLVMSEFIAQSPKSIGNALYMGRINFMYDHVFAWTIIIIFIVIMIERLVNRLN